MRQQRHFLGNAMGDILATDVLDVSVLCHPDNYSGTHQNEEKGIRRYFLLILLTATSEVIRTNFRVPNSHSQPRKERTSKISLFIYIYIYIYIFFLELLEGTRGGRLWGYFSVQGFYI